MSGPSGASGATAPWPAVLVVMGVSGSGKSTIAEKLAERLHWTFEDADWFHPPANIAKMKAGTPLTDDDRWPWLAAIAAWIDRIEREGTHGIVACSALKRSYRAALVRDKPDAVRVVYLDGSKAVIADRMAHRHGHFMPTGLLDSQFDALEVPGPDEAPITVSVARMPEEIVEDAIRQLAACSDGPPPRVESPSSHAERKPRTEPS